MSPHFWQPFPLPSRLKTKEDLVIRQRLQRPVSVLLPLGLLLLWHLTVAPLGAEPRAELVRLVDSPTAGLVPKGQFGLDLRLFPNGGILGQIDAGVLKRFSITISFGGEQIIGDAPIQWNPRVESSARYRLIEESTSRPALVLGYSTQGYGTWSDKRYQTKSKGLFVALSKNYLSPLGQFGLHGGANLTYEDGDDSGPSGWFGIDLRLNEDLALCGEYDLALDDNGPTAFSLDQGFLNGAIYWSVAPQLQVGLLLKNLLEKGGPQVQLSRELSVRYTETF